MITPGWAGRQETGVRRQESGDRRRVRHGVSGLHAAARTNLPDTRPLVGGIRVANGISLNMRRLAFVLSIGASLVPAQPNWREFSLSPARVQGALNPMGAVRRGTLRARSISARALIAISAGVPPARVLGPDWIDSENYAILAVLADDSQGRLRTRSTAHTSLDDDFQNLFAQEIASRFRLEFQRERQERRGFVLRLSASGIKARRSRSLEGARFMAKGMPIINVRQSLEVQGATLLEFSDWLERRLGVPVVAPGELPDGVWDFRIPWTTGDENSLGEAIRDQVGLELLPGNVTAEYVVISRVERPELGRR
jgi:uncharacterized protein (TIGR03435 family)